MLVQEGLYKQSFDRSEAQRTRSLASEKYTAMSSKQLHRKSSSRSLSSTPFGKLSRIACYIKAARKSLSSRQNLVAELITSHPFPGFPLFPVSTRTEDRKIMSSHDKEPLASVSQLSVCRPSQNLQVSCDSLPIEVSNSSEVSMAEERRMLDIDAAVSDDENSCCSGKPLSKFGIPAVFVLALLVVFFSPGKEVAVGITIATYLIHRLRRRFSLSMLSVNEDSKKSSLSLDMHVGRKEHGLTKCNSEALHLKTFNIASDNDGEQICRESPMASSNQISDSLFSRQRSKRQIKMHSENRLIKQQTMPYIHHQGLVTKPQEAMSMDLHVKPKNMVSVHRPSRENHDLNLSKEPVKGCNDSPRLTQSTLNRTSTVPCDSSTALRIVMPVQAYQRSKSLPQKYSQVEKDVKTLGKPLTIRTSPQTQESKNGFAKFKLCVVLLMVLCGLVYGRAIAIFMALFCGFLFSTIHRQRRQNLD